jgi:zinc-ribbon domain
MHCPDCQESLPANAQFCTNCGLRVVGAVTGATQRLDPAAGQRCGKCGGLMERGFIPDEYRNRNEITVWVRGAPVRHPSTGILDLGGVQMWQVVTLRCTTCGYLESYATDTFGAA